MAFSVFVKRLERYYVKYVIAIFQFSCYNTALLRNVSSKFKLGKKDVLLKSNFAYT